MYSKYWRLVDEKPVDRVERARLDSMMRRLLLALAVVVLTPVPANAAPKAESTYFNSLIPSRVDHLIGFRTTGFAIHPRDQKLKPISVRYRGKSYRYVFWDAAAATGGTASEYVKQMVRDRRYPDPKGVFLDRKLTAKERKHLQVRVDLGRDADVLAVTADHPACTAGVSRSAVKGIAAGKIKTWSAAGVPAPAGGDAITLRRAGMNSNEYAEPRFGAPQRLPKGMKSVSDGGLAEAANGNTSIAAVTSWSRARLFERIGRVCVVPVGGATVDDASVRALSHPDAYPISFVTFRRLRNNAVGSIVAAFVKYLTSPRATQLFREGGMLMAKGAWD
jgi:hypothetical protein